MRALLFFVLLLGLLPAGRAAEAATGRVLKVLPFYLDAQGRDALSPSLFDRDAYQAQLRAGTNAIAGIRYAVLWQAGKTHGEPCTLRAELRAIGDGGRPRFKTLETEVTPGWFRHWTDLPLTGDEFKQTGEVVAWRVTLWRGGQLLGEQKSLLW